MVQCTFTKDKYMFKYMYMYMYRIINGYQITSKNKTDF